MRNKDEYLTALCVLAGLETPIENCCYLELMTQLYNIEYIYSVPNDDNRALDGLALRSRIKSDSMVGEPCSLLEMLLSLARRCEDDLLYNPRKGDRSVDWFWMMLRNLGLSKFRDSTFGTAWKADDITGITDIFMDREYDWYGVGGIFPLKGRCKDQREVEVWYQMSAYLLEHPELE